MNNELETKTEYGEIEVNGKNIKIVLKEDEDFKNDYALLNDLNFEDTLDLSNVVENVEKVDENE